MWNTVLFDLDGTLTDSGPGIMRSVKYALEKGFGICVGDEKELASFVGPPLKEQFEEYAGLGEEEAEKAVCIYRERYTQIGIFENEVYEGIPELLRRLKEAGMTLAVSSSKPTVFCVRILEYFKISEYFDVICGSELDGARTLKSDVVKEVLRLLGKEQSRSEVVLVGDRKYDVSGAKEMGIGSIGVAYGYGGRTELENEKPDAVCDTVRELQDVLLGQKKEVPADNGQKNKCETPASDHEKTVKKNTKAPV